MIRIYLDDTAGEAFAGFGGFAGKAEAWEALEKDWIAENEINGIPEFHARQYPNLVSAYASVVLRHEIYLVGRTIDLNSFTEYSPRHRIRSSFALNVWASAASDCFWRVIDWLHLMPEEQCALVIDCKTEYQPSVRDAILYAVKVRNFDRLVSLIFINQGNGSLFPMRQVGDLGANLTAKHTAARHYNLRLDKDLGHDFYCAGHLLNITHADARSIEGMADIFTDPQWAKYWES